VQFIAMADVTKSTEEQQMSADGEKKSCCEVRLQITDMAIPAQSKAEASEEESEARRSALYKDD
jgi:hypothetical protein